MIRRPKSTKFSKEETRIIYFALRLVLTDVFHYAREDSRDTSKVSSLILGILAKLKMSTNNMTDEHLENLYNNNHIISKLIHTSMSEDEKVEEVVEEVEEEETAE